MALYTFQGCGCDALWPDQAQGAIAPPSSTTVEVAPGSTAVQVTTPSLPWLWIIAGGLLLAMLSRRRTTTVVTS